MMMTAIINQTRPRCQYPDCGALRAAERYAPEFPEYCRAHQNPATWHMCECGVTISRVSKRCIVCAARHNGAMRRKHVEPVEHESRTAIKRCPPITAEGMDILWRSRRPWSSLTRDAQLCQMQTARDMIAIGLLTEDQSRELYRDAWIAIQAEIDNGATAMNCVEVAE